MANLQNGVSFKDLSDAADELGAEAGKGKDTQVKFYMKLVEGAYHSVIDLDGDKHGAGVDDAEELTRRYVKAQSGANIFDAKAPNQRKACSCARVCVKLGQWPKGGTGEPLATMNNLMTIRQKLKANPTTAKNLLDAGNTLLSYARRQIKQDAILDDDELRDLCMKKDKSLPSAEDVLDGIRKSLKKLVDGKAASNTAQDSTPHVQEALTALNERMREIAEERKEIDAGIAAEIGKAADAIDDNELFGEDDPSVAARKAAYAAMEAGEQAVSEE